MKNVQTDNSAVRFVDDIFRLAIKERAGDIHFEPREKGMAVRFRVDGDLRYAADVPADICGKVISRLKVISDMDLTERRKPQEGRGSIDENTDIRVSVLPTLYGEKVAIRILNKDLCPREARLLGIDGENLLRYNELIRSDSGLILIAGTTGSGKTSTMYAMLTELARDDVNTVTLEDPVEYSILGTNQVSMNENAGLSFSVGLKSVLRQDPDITAVGEVRDSETAKTAYILATTGRLTLATVHAANALSLPVRMEDLGISRQMLEEVLSGVIIQRLLRRVCKGCGGRGCEDCGGRGYMGRIGAFGIAVFPKGEKALTEGLRKADQALEENCRRLAEGGITAAWEV